MSTVVVQPCTVMWTLLRTESTYSLGILLWIVNRPGIQYLAVRLPLIRWWFGTSSSPQRLFGKYIRKVVRFNHLRISYLVNLLDRLYHIRIGNHWANGHNKNFYRWSNYRDSHIKTGDLLKTHQYLNKHFLLNVLANHLTKWRSFKEAYVATVW